MGSDNDEVRAFSSLIRIEDYREALEKISIIAGCLFACA